MPDPTHLDALREQIDARGEQRLQGLTIAESALRDIADMAAAALDAGIPRREVAARAGVSVGALDAALREARLRAPVTVP